jgi:hypothetical protein
MEELLEIIQLIKGFGINSLQITAFSITSTANLREAQNGFV